MPTITIRDDALWAKHVSGTTLRNTISALEAGALLRLRIDGRPIGFRKMADGRDGRPTPGLKADPDDAAGRADWAKLQERRGETVEVALDAARQPVDPYLAYLDQLFWEWNTPEDCEAFDHL